MVTGELGKQIIAAALNVPSFLRKLPLVKAKQAPIEENWFRGLVELPSKRCRY